MRKMTLHHLMLIENYSSNTKSRQDASPCKSDSCETEFSLLCFQVYSKWRMQESHVITITWLLNLEFLLQEEEFNDIIRSSNRINFLYGYMFDEEIVNEELASALTQLLKAAWRVQSEPLWVPASWVQ